MIEEAWKVTAGMTEDEFHKAWQKAEKLAFSGSELDNPRMLMLSLFYYHTAPLKVRQFFSGDQICIANKIAQFLHAAIDDTEEWLQLSPIAIEERKHLNSITSICDDINWIESTLSSLTSETELKFIEQAPEQADRKIRVKILAALDVQRSIAEMRAAERSHPAAYITSYFFMLRSLVQFASYAAAIDGTHSQLGRKTPKAPDYCGYLVFIKRYFPDFPSSGDEPQYLWDKIKGIFHTDGLIITCNRYKMTLVRVHLAKGKHQEGLRQVSPAGKQKILGFKAFSDLLRKLKKGSLKLT